ncbi:unnamed protein product [Onchocerca flexuosa]|uniref:Uncharacterized protein n=1 Tax=Onchocerca flexuosa TaxID=387005 RepID=A0A183I5T2_9BILA|nr:unnamed protein product [Onchocerca flexuosa]
MSNASGRQRTNSSSSYQISRREVTPVLSRQSSFVKKGNDTTTITKKRI